MAKTFRVRTVKKKYRILERAISSYTRARNPAAKAKARAKVVEIFSQIVQYYQQRGMKTTTRLTLSETVCFEVGKRTEGRFYVWDPPFYRDW